MVFYLCVPGHDVVHVVKMDSIRMLGLVPAATVKAKAGVKSICAGKACVIVL